MKIKDIVDEIINVRKIDNLYEEDFNILGDNIKYLNVEYETLKDINLSDHLLKNSPYLIVILSSNKEISLNHQEEVYALINTLLDIPILIYRYKNIQLKVNRIEVFYSPY